MSKKYDVVWLLGEGIGNVIEALYSVEYCLKLGLKCGVILHNIPTSFTQYVSSCYQTLIVENSSAISTKHLVHSWLYRNEIEVQFENYFYVNPDSNSVRYLSEDELYLTVVKGLFPSENEINRNLTLLQESNPNIEIHDLSNKCAIYPGSSAQSPVKRWPHFGKLIEQLGAENVIVLGGSDDLDFQYSYRYPKWISKLLPTIVTNRIEFWRTCKLFGILLPHAHSQFPSTLAGLYINKLAWPEIVYILRRVKAFIGNDGGLSHLASAANVEKGIAIFGPSSIQKNKPFNPRIKSLSLNYGCQPCFYSKGGIHMAKNYISCPFGIKCLHDISVNEVLKNL